MAVLKRELSDTPDGRWLLVYDHDHRAFYVEGYGTLRNTADRHR